MLLLDLDGVWPEPESLHHLWDVQRDLLGKTVGPSPEVP